MNTTSPLSPMSDCVFCGGRRWKATFLEDTVFNQKTFSYRKCHSCGLVMVHPLPEAGDFIKMYPVDYQGEIDSVRSGFYDDIIKQIRALTPGPKLLDYGCGGGRFIRELDPSAFQITGTEYNPDMVKALQKAFPASKFLTIDNFFQSSEKYDVIFVSNVFEHLVNPKEVLQLLYGRLNEGGILVSEGPLEAQVNVANSFRNLWFGFRKYVMGRKASHAPFHITRTSGKCQLNFFTSAGFRTLDYRVMETAWPFPASWKTAASVSKKIQYMVAWVSIRFSRLIPGWGNNFFYIGKKENTGSGSSD